MTSPEEEARRKSAEAKAKESENPAAPKNDALGFLGQLVGDATNLAVDAVSGTHSGDKVLSSITPKLAEQYQRGKEVQARIDRGEVKRDQLKDADKKNLDAFEGVKKSISHVPLYDRDSLTRYIEKGIEQKAKAAPHETSRPAVAKDVPVKPSASKPAENQVHKDAGDAKRSTSHTAQPPHSDKPVRKDAPGATAAMTPAESKTPGQRPSHQTRPQERSDEQSSDARGLKPQPDKTAGTSAREVKPESQKNVLPGASDVRNPEVRTAVSPEASKTVKVTPNSRTEPQRTDNKVERVFPISPELGHRQESQKIVETNKDATRPTSPEPNTRALDGNTSKTNSTANKRTAGEVNAFETFERRTSIDARQQQDQKQDIKQDIKQDLKQDLKQEMKLTPSVRGFEQSNQTKDQTQLPKVDIKNGAGERGSFENMRRVLEERTSFANGREAKSLLVDRSSIRSQGNTETRDILRNPPGGEGRITLSEIKNRLPEQSVQQIVRISEKRFPAGLRWQNDLRQPETVPPSSQQPGRVRLPETPGTSTTIKAAERVTGNSSVKPTMPGEISPNSGGQKSSATAKSFSFNGPVNDRYITGAEIALAAIIAAAGAKRIRFDEITTSGSDIGTQIPRVQKIQAFLPNNTASEKAPGRADVHRTDSRRADLPAVDDKAVFSNQPKVSPQVTFTSTFIPSEKRFLTGIEVALAAVIASCGTARIRQNLADKKIPEQESPNEDVPGTLRYLQTHKFNRKTILFGSSDTFVSLADKHLLNVNLGWLIADLNLDKTKETYIDGKRVVEVRSRQVIELPTTDECAVFLKNWKEEFKPENLITIVVETQIDRELLNEHLCVFVDGGEKSFGLPAPGVTASSMYGRTAGSADGSAVLPSLALETKGLMRIATERVMEFTHAALSEGRNPFSRIREFLKRDRIKRRF